MKYTRDFFFSKNFKFQKLRSTCHARFKIFLQKKKTLERPLIFVSKGIVGGKHERKSSRECTRNEGGDCPSTCVFARSNIVV